MLNDWMLEQPEDSDNWFFIPSPRGQRNICVAANGKTRFFSNRGECRLEIETSLPGGTAKNMSGTKSKHTLLDVIVSYYSKTIYVIDILKWNGMEYYESDFEFRQTWKNYKLLELDPSHSNWKIKNLNAFAFNDSSAVEFYKQVEYDLDGLLLYHREGMYYCSGVENDTFALFGWIKHDKMAEIVGQTCEFQNVSKEDKKPDMTDK